MLFLLNRHPSKFSFFHPVPVVLSLLSRRLVISSPDTSVCVCQGNIYRAPCCLCTGCRARRSINSCQLPACWWTTYSPFLAAVCSLPSRPSSFSPPSPFLGLENRARSIPENCIQQAVLQLDKLQQQWHWQGAPVFIQRSMWGRAGTFQSLILSIHSFITHYSFVYSKFSSFHSFQVSTRMYSNHSCIHSFEYSFVYPSVLTKSKFSSDMFNSTYL